MSALDPSEVLQASLAQAKLSTYSPAAALTAELNRLRTRDQAARLYRRELEGPAQPLDVATGTELAARALEAPRWRVEGLLTAEGSTLVTAQRKTGKTTLVLNLARALLTGEPFLGEFAVTPVVGPVCLFNYEVSGPQIGRWAAEVGVPGDQLVVVNLRGRRNPLGHDDDRAALAAQLRAWGVEVLICDPFANAYTGESQNDAGQVAAFVRELGLFTRAEVGATDLVLTNHAGWNADRTRGSSALEDWADSLVKLTADNYGNRYISATGRDVDVAEGALTFDPEARRLTLDRTGNKWAAQHTQRLNGLVDAIVAVVAEVPGLGVRGIQDALTERRVTFGKGDVGPAIDTAAATGRLVVKTESRGKRACYLPEPADAATDTAVQGDRPTVPGLSHGTVPLSRLSIRRDGAGTQGHLNTLGQSEGRAEA